MLLTERLALWKKIRSLKMIPSQAVTVEYQLEYDQVLLLMWRSFVWNFEPYARNTATLIYHVTKIMPLGTDFLARYHQNGCVRKFCSKKLTFAILICKLRIHWHQLILRRTQDLAQVFLDNIEHWLHSYYCNYAIADPPSWSITEHECLIMKARFSFQPLSVLQCSLLHLYLIAVQ